MIDQFDIMDTGFEKNSPPIFNPIPPRLSQRKYITPRAINLEPEVSLSNQEPQGTIQSNASSDSPTPQLIRKSHRRNLLADKQTSSQPNNPLTSPRQEPISSPISGNRQAYTEMNPVSTPNVSDFIVQSPRDNLAGARSQKSAPNLPIKPKADLSKPLVQEQESQPQPNSPSHHTQTQIPQPKTIFQIPQPRFPPTMPAPSYADGLRGTQYKGLELSGLRTPNTPYRDNSNLETSHDSSIQKK